MAGGGRKLVGKVVVLGFSGLLLVAYTVRSHAPIEVALAIVAGSAVAFGLYLIAPSGRP
jgi:hypothetical protein